MKKLTLAPSVSALHSIRSCSPSEAEQVIRVARSVKTYLVRVFLQTLSSSICVLRFRRMYDELEEISLLLIVLEMVPKSQCIY